MKEKCSIFGILAALMLIVSLLVPTYLARPAPLSAADNGPPALMIADEAVDNYNYLVASVPGNLTSQVTIETAYKQLAGSSDSVDYYVVAKTGVHNGQSLHTIAMLPVDGKESMLTALKGYSQSATLPFALAKDATMPQLITELETATAAYQSDTKLDYSCNDFWRAKPPVLRAPLLATAITQGGRSNWLTCAADALFTAPTTPTDVAEAGANANMVIMLNSNTVPAGTFLCGILATTSAISLPSSLACFYTSRSNAAIGYVMSVPVTYGLTLSACGLFTALDQVQVRPG